MPLSFRKQLTARMRFNSSLDFRAQISTSCSSEALGLCCRRLLGARRKTCHWQQQPAAEKALRTLSPAVLTSPSGSGLSFFFFLFLFFYYGRMMSRWLILLQFNSSSLICCHAGNNTRPTANGSLAEWLVAVIEFHTVFVRAFFFFSLSHQTHLAAAF